MRYRIFSQIISRYLIVASAATTSAAIVSQAPAQAPPQNSAGLYTDEASGIVYQKVTRTVERPVVETKVEQREQTLYRPQTVTETRPENRTVFTPVMQYQWEPRVHGRWNPFQKPTVAYHQVPRCYWEAQNQVVQRTNTRTEWVAEKRTIDVPQRIVRMEREQTVDFEPVGRVAPGSTPSTPSSSIASRLRPLTPGTRVEPTGSSQQIVSSQPMSSSGTLVASTIGRMTSDPPRRTTGQSGLRHYARTGTRCHSWSAFTTGQ